MGNRTITTSDQREYSGDISQFIDKEQYVEFHAYGTTTKIYKNFIVADKKDDDCFVATVVYRSSHAPEVETLRLYRDLVLARSRMGRIFIRLYYRWLGPVAATIVRLGGEPLHRSVKFFLDALLRSIQTSPPRK